MALVHIFYSLFLIPVPAFLQAAQVLFWESSVFRLCTVGSFPNVLVIVPMPVPAILQAALVLSRKSSVCRLFTGGSHSHVLVLVSDARACCLAGCSGLELGVISMSSVR